MARKRIVRRTWVNVKEDQPRFERLKYLRQELGKTKSKGDDIWNSICNEVKFKGL